MSSFGKTAAAAAKKLKAQSEYYSTHKEELGNFGPATRSKLTIPPGASASVASRAPAPRPPQGSTLGNDAKNIKIRQKYEEIPEAGMSRPSEKKKKASSF